ncbi:MAG TPA: LytTR family DNA-binding domain-containing protein [Terrimicrobiaceae bacterium]
MQSNLSAIWSVERTRRSICLPDFRQFRTFVGIPSGPDRGEKQIEVRRVHYREMLREISCSCFGDGEPARLRRDDFALLTDDSKAWIVQIEGISLLEACRNSTLVHFADGNVLLRRSLGSIERRLASSMFFRANRSSIVNLGHVKQQRLSKDGGLVFVLKDGKEVAFSRRQKHSLP